MKRGDRYLFDTNAASNQEIGALRKLPSGQQVSGVVFTELMAAAEPREYRQYKYAWELAVKEGKLVLPIKRDWPAIGQILHLLAQERKRAASGKAPKRTPTAKQEMLADVMIAVSAARAGVIVVTDDNDFAAIQRAHNSMEFTSVRDFLALARGESKEV